MRPYSRWMTVLLLLAIAPGISARRADAQAPPTPEVQALLKQGQDLYSQGKLDEAQPLFQSARAKAAAVADKAGEGIALRRLGNIAADRRQVQKADECFEQALALHRQAGDRIGEAYIVYSQGRARVVNGQPERGKVLLEKALSAFRETMHKPGEALALKLLGDSYASTNTNQKAIEYYLQASALFDQLEDRHVAASALGNMGLVYTRLNEPARAAERFLQQSMICRQVSDRRNETIALINAGKSYRDAAQPQKANEALLTAVGLATERKEIALEAEALQTVGEIELSRARFLESIRYFEQALTFYREEKQSVAAADVLNSLGIAYRDRGDIRKARENFQQAIDLYREAGKEVEAARTLVNIGIAYTDVGQQQQALEFFLQARSILRKAGNRDGEAAVLNNIGLAYSRLHERQRALEYYEASLPIRRELKDRIGEARSLDNIGYLYSQMGNAKKALEYLNQALELCRASEDDIGTARTLDSLGHVFAKSRQFEKALDYYNQALAMRREEGRRDEEVNTLTAMGDLETSRDRFQAAGAYYDTAITEAEKVRDDLGGFRESKAAYLQSRLPLYYSAMNAQLKLGHTEHVFELAQRTKARNLLDLMASGRIDLTGELPSAERDELQDLRTQADVLNQRMVREGVENQVGSKKRYEALRKETQQVEARLQAFTDTLYSRHPRMADSNAAHIATWREISGLLPAGTALLEYVVVSKDDVRLLVVSSRGGKPRLSLYPVSHNYPTLADQARRLRASCADPRKPYRKDARSLYDALLKPAETEIRSARRLVICPDGALWDVPFAALVSGRQGSFVGQRYEIAYAYSATGAEAALTLATNRKTGPTGSILVAANPAFGASDRFGDLKDIPGQRPLDLASRPIDSASRPLDIASRAFDTVSRGGEMVRGKAIPALPGTQREANALQKLFPNARVLTGEQAQETTIKQEAGNYRYLHFATHGFVNDGSPLLSSVVMAKPLPSSPNTGGVVEDGFLTAREIYGLNLNAEMTVLSACNTARGENRTGEGVIGLTWALFVAGCPTQVVSQWAVDDASTAMLMSRFYENLQTRKMGKAQALKEAEQWLRGQNAKYAHPYYWAPFVLNGAWK